MQQSQLWAAEGRKAYGTPADVGRALVRAAGRGRALARDDQLDPQVVRVLADYVKEHSLIEAAGLVSSYDATEGRFSEQTWETYAKHVGLFIKTMEAHGRRTLREVSGTDVADFIRSPVIKSGRAAPPSASTQSNRRSALNAFFTTARHLGLYDGDPTVDLALDRRPRDTLARPLLDDEISVARIVAETELIRGRKPAAFALAEATARAAEIATVAAADVDLDRGVVRLPGSRTVRPREGRLTEWGIEILRPLVASAKEGERLVVQRARSASSATSTASGAVHDILKRSGLAADPRVKPTSVALWAPRKTFEATGRIDLVAIELGLDSIEQAAKDIGWDWRP